MKIALLFLLSVIAALGTDFPGEEWPKATAAAVGLDERSLIEARDYALTGGGSGFIIRNGQLIVAWGDPKQRYDLKSSTKSFGTAALGLAVADGKMKLTDKARTHHPAFGIPPEENAAKGWLEEITVQHLAAQTAGFDKPGGFVPLLFKPGTEWAYSDSGPNWLAECITLAYRRDLDELMFERVFTPIGIKRTDLTWRKNQYRPDLLDGIKRREFGAGIHANVDAMARYGYLWLRAGSWNGKQILPADFVDLARTNISGVPGLPVRKREDFSNAANHYGFLWWNNADETIEGLPLDAYWSWGLYDSLIVVIPSLDIVVARAGQSWKRTKGADHYEVLKPFLLPIVRSVKAGPSASATDASRRSSRIQPSLTIETIAWDSPDTIIRAAKGSDNWPMTWTDDDALYTAYGDGNGFPPFVPKKLSLGLAKIAGMPPDIGGINLPSPTAEALGDGKHGRKASGIIMVNGVLYLLVRNVDNAQLGWSSDHAATWTWADWKFTESLGCPTFLNFGRNYAGARDEFVYLYSHDSNSAYDRADRMILVRVPRDRIRERSAYEFFVRRDAEGRPVWSKELSERGAVFANPGACYRSGVTYNAGLRRYLWCQTGRGTDPRFAGGLTICDAPEPWGPWTVAFHTGSWDVGPGETSSLPTKWMSADGRTVHLVFSGNDHFSVRRGKIVLRSVRESESAK